MTCETALLPTAPLRDISKRAAKGNARRVEASRAGEARHVTRLARRAFRLKARAASAERLDDLAIGGLRERLQRPATDAAAHAERQRETRRHRVVGRLADRDHVAVAHGQVELLEAAPHVAEHLLGRIEPRRRFPHVLDALLCPVDKYDVGRHVTPPSGAVTGTIAASPAPVLRSHTVTLAVCAEGSRAPSNAGLPGRRPAAPASGAEPRAEFRHRRDHRLDPPAGRSQRIFGLRRHGRIDGAADEPRPLQHVEPLGEHARADAGERALQLRIALLA